MNELLAVLAAPTWPILAWAGSAATLIAMLVLPPRREPREKGSAGHLRRLALGLFIFTPLYGLTFEILGRADILSGLTLGFAHGLMSLALAFPHRRTARNGDLARLLAGRVLFGVIIGFLYPVPTA